MVCSVYCNMCILFICHFSFSSLLFISPSSSLVPFSSPSLPCCSCSLPPFLTGPLSSPSPLSPLLPLSPTPLSSPSSLPPLSPTPLSSPSSLPPLSPTPLSSPSSLPLLPPPSPSSLPLLPPPSPPSLPPLPPTPLSSPSSLPALPPPHQVGCGAIGCEMLKNYAMLGVGRKPNGLVSQSFC